MLYFSCLLSHAQAGLSNNSHAFLLLLRASHCTLHSFDTVSSLYTPGAERIALTDGVCSAQLFSTFIVSSGVFKMALLCAGVCVCCRSLLADLRVLVGFRHGEPSALLMGPIQGTV